MNARSHPTIALPRRPVPPSLRCAVIVGGMVNQLGWGLLAFGGFLAGVFGRNADLSAFPPDGSRQRATATITAVEKTGFSDRPGRRSRKFVYAHRYSFRDTGGAEHTGASYGWHTNGAADTQVGRNVQVEYPAGQPQQSRIVGMRRRPLGPAAALTWLIPAAGVLVVLRGLRRGLRDVHLLTHGQPATGVLKSKRATATKINDRQVYELTFEFAGDDGTKHTAKARTHQAELLTDDAEELLVYDPMQPDRAVMIDALPGQPVFDEAGLPHARRPARGWLSLVLPAIAIIALAAAVAK